MKRTEKAVWLIKAILALAILISRDAEGAEPNIPEWADPNQYAGYVLDAGCSREGICAGDIVRYRIWPADPNGHWLPPDKIRIELVSGDNTETYYAGNVLCADFTPTAPGIFYLKFKMDCIDPNYRCVLPAEGRKSAVAFKVEPAATLPPFRSAVAVE